MAEIRIELRDFNTTTNTFNIVGDLDIVSSDDFPLSLTFKNFDIRDLNSRGGSFSKSFKVPATKNNNKIFGHIYKDGNIDKNNVRKDISSTIYVDNLPIISGSLRVSKVVSNKDVVEYECLFLGDNMDWANKLKNKELKDLRFSSAAYSSYPPTNIINPTFSNPHGITASDSGTVTATLQQPYHSGNYTFNQDKFIYPLVSVGEGISSKSQVTEVDFVPCLYLKNIWDKIFQQLGYSVSSTFCDSQFFKSLIVPLNFERSGESVNNKFGRIERGSDDTVRSGGFYENLGTVTLSRAVGNPERNFSSPSTFTDVYYVFDGDVSQDDFEGGDTSGSTGNVQVGSSGLNATTLVKNDVGDNVIQWNIDLGITSDSFDGFDDNTLEFELFFRVARLVEDDDVLNHVVKHQSETYTVTLNEIHSPHNLSINYSDSLSLDDAVGSKYALFVAFKLTDWAGQDSGNFYLTFKQGSYFQISGSTFFSIGDSVDSIQYLLPQGSQADFLSGITQMFNLQYRTDAASKVVFIEPYDHFYEASSNSVDWSDKIDYSKDIQDEFIYDIKSKLEFKYKDASDDAFLERYNKKNDVDWGSYKEVDESGALFDGEYKVENKFFSPTFNWTEPDYIDTTAGHELNSTPLIPIYHKEFSDLSTNDERAEKSFDIGARVLLLPSDNPYGDGGLMASTETKAYTGYSYAPLPSQEIENESSQNFNFARGNFINIHNMWKSPSANEGQEFAFNVATLNNGYEDVDLNLSYSDVIYNSTAISNTRQTKMRGLYYYYYSKMIKQLKQKPRLKIAYFNLKTSDISLLDFKKLVYINGVYYRINKIIDFQPHKQQSTKVELLEYSFLGRDDVLLGESANLESITL